MPAHSSHLLQPLDVACFSPLKRAYGDVISGLARNRTHYISKETFLSAFKTTFERAFTIDNIRQAFEALDSVPHDLDAVLSKLDVRLRTPTPPPRDDVAWEAKTPRTAKEVEAQSTLIRQRIRNRPRSSTSSLDEQVRQLSKGA